MADTTTAEGFQFLISELKADKSSPYADLRKKADKKGLTIYPVMFGRAKAMLGLVKSAKRGEGKFAKASAAKRRAGRPKVSGGDGSKSERIRKLLGSGMSAADIAKQVGCSVNLVYVVKSHGNGRRARPGREEATPLRERYRTRSASANGQLDGIVAAFRERERERDRYRRALEQVRAIVEGVK